MCLGNKYHKSIESLIRSMGKSYLIKCDENFYTRTGNININDFNNYSSFNLYTLINSIKKRPIKKMANSSILSPWCEE